MSGRVATTDRQQDVKDNLYKQNDEILIAENEALKPKDQVIQGNNKNGNVCGPNNQNSSKNTNILFQTYKKRPGTSDAGKEFEFMMCALYALKLCNNNDIVDFKMTTNNQKYGDFDDISLEIETEDKTRTFLLQLKHKENENQYVTDQKLTSANSEFNLIKYLRSLQELNVGDVTCLVYTNSPAKLENGSNFNISFKTESKERKMNVTVKRAQAFGFLQLLQNKKNPNVVDNIFQFDIIQEETTETFCENFFLMTGQDNLKTVKATVRKMLTDLLKVNIYDSFVFFMKEWWSGRFVLTKREVISKLVELAMSPWIQTVSSTNVTSKTKLLSTGIMNFDMTVVKNTNNNIINNIWGDTTEETESKKAAQRYHIQENQNQRSKVWWFLDKVALIVKVDSQNEEQVKQSIKLLECLPQKKKLILVGNIGQDEFQKWTVLENLEDLCCVKDIYDKVIRDFRISLQGRTSINLEELIRNSKDCVGVVEIDDLLEITQLECLKVGKIENCLPKSYISRKVSADCVNTTDLLDGLRRVEKHVLIINCLAECVNKLYTRYALVMQLDEFLRKENVDKSRNLILVSIDEPCTYSKFDSVRKKLGSFQVHLFQTVDEDCYIRLMNVGHKKLLGNCRNVQIDETEIFNYFKNQLNVIFAPPGMGKSTLFNIYLKNKKILVLLDGVDELESQNVNVLLERSSYRLEASTCGFLLEKIIKKKFRDI